jgi:hypothetical protein
MIERQMDRWKDFQEKYQGAWDRDARQSPDK